MKTIDNELELIEVPLDMSDIMQLCQEYSQLGFNIQMQMEYIFENGIQEAITNKIVKMESLPFIKNFLRTIYQNPLLGEAREQAMDYIREISDMEYNLKIKNMN